MPEPLFPVKFPKPQLVETFLVRLPDGTFKSFTREQLDQANKPKEGGKA